MCIAFFGLYIILLLLTNQPMALLRSPPFCFLAKCAAARHITDSLPSCMLLSFSLLDSQHKYCKGKLYMPQYAWKIKEGDVDTAAERADHGGVLFLKLDIGMCGASQRLNCLASVRIVIKHGLYIF